MSMTLAYRAGRSLGRKTIRRIGFRRKSKPEDRGTPLIGRIRASGKAEPDEDWQEEWGRHIPQRYGKGHDIYGLELEGVGQSVVFRNIPPWEFRDGPVAVYCWNGWEVARLIRSGSTRHTRSDCCDARWAMPSLRPGKHRAHRQNHRPLAGGNKPVVIALTAQHDWYGQYH